MVASTLPEGRVVGARAKRCDCVELLRRWLCLIFCCLRDGIGVRRRCLLHGAVGQKLVWSTTFYRISLAPPQNGPAVIRRPLMTASVILLQCFN